MRITHIERNTRTAHQDLNGNAAFARAAGLLCLAAAPTFAVMALLSGLSTGRPDMICSASPSVFPLGDMGLMYLLMSAFHATSWLKWIAQRRIAAHRTLEFRASSG